MDKKKQVYFLMLLVVIFFAINYQFIDDALVGVFEEEGDFGIVERVIDGDTIIVDGEKVRLLGINSPERGEDYYEEAKEFLEMVILNKSVELRFGKEKVDRYGRKLAYVFLRGENVNLEMVDEGYANFYFPSEKDAYYDRAVRNWEKCVKMNKYLCEKSEDECVELKKFDYEDEVVVFENVCLHDVDLKGWEIKDEGRKRFVFGNFILGGGEEVSVIVSEGINSPDRLYWRGQKYVWTNTGDTLFLRDAEGKLVLWESY